MEVSPLGSLRSLIGRGEFRIIVCCSAQQRSPASITDVTEREPPILLT